MTQPDPAMLLYAIDMAIIRDGMLTEAEHRARMQVHLEITAKRLYDVAQSFGRVQRSLGREPA